MTIDQFVEDTRELVTYLLERFKKQKVVLQGRSWGSALGLLTISKYPELFSVYVGIGQISDMEASEKASYQWTLEQARARGEQKALKELEEMGPPPYTGDWLEKFNTQRKYVAQFGGEMHGNKHGGNGKIVGSLLFSDEYTIMDRLHYNHSVQESLRLVHPQLMRLNLFESVPQVAVPVLLVEGRHDQVVPSHLAAAYFEKLEAPSKELMWFENSAHMPDIEEADRFHALLIERVLPIAKHHSKTVNAANRS
jgi:pimeloyl-ACP methyl ester carboxylesterase